jgi:hypothetical protein
MIHQVKKAYVVQNRNAVEFEYLKVFQEEHKELQIDVKKYLGK